VNELGLGKDMWQVPFENITKILEVPTRELKSQEDLADRTIDLLLHRASLSGSNRTDEDCYLAFLPPHLSSTWTPPRHLCYDSALLVIHGLVRHSNCASVLPDQLLLDPLG
jgi:hypothetical protein